MYEDEDSLTNRMPCPGPPSCNLCDGTGVVPSGAITQTEIRKIETSLRGSGEPPPRGPLSKDISFGQIYERTEYERMRESMRREIEYEVRMRLEQEMQVMRIPATFLTESEIEKIRTPESKTSTTSNPENRKLMLD